jgi:hypothetical protein
MNSLERIARQQRRSIEVPGAGLETYLRTIVTMLESCSAPPRRGGYLCFEHFILRNGRPMNRIVHPGRLMAKRECFRNAALCAIDPAAKVIYCEGFAHTGLIPIHHAWLIGPGGAVIDPTWGMAGLEYFGVAFRRDYVRKITVKSEAFAGMLDLPELKWPTLDAHPIEWRHEIMDRLPLPESEAWK